MTDQDPKDCTPCAWKGWGNSVIAVNFKYWTCSYCGEKIGDGKPFQIMRINGRPQPYVFDKEFCMIKQIQKLEADKR